jgi:uncharacterized membrane protein
MLWLGIIASSTYELTNMATLPNWPLSIVIVDMVWGVVLCAVVDTAGYATGCRIAPGRGD